MKPSQLSPTNNLLHPKYRPDIDGLRAIAVLSVVAFHAFPNWVRGGFVGVDVFFVISGFLISSIILSNLDRNSFSFVEFYSRRIRRIFPALFIVMISCFFFGWFVLLADEYKQLGKHIAGGAGFVSNFMLWKESGYFDIAAETKPLLHLWSLGIEEQYYVLWPLLLWVTWKKGFNLLTVITTAAFISFAFNIATYHSDSVANFYSPQTRFWELAVGSALAYLSLYKHKILASLSTKSIWKLVNSLSSRINEGSAQETLSIVGIILILVSALVITREMRYPGFWAILPTFGTAMIIAAGTKAWLNRVFLSNRILVWVGLISFPLYLWHWPLLSFLRIIQGETPEASIRVIAVLVSFLLAWLTYRIVEKPLRFGKHGVLKTVTLILLMSAMGYAGFNTYKRDGLEFRGNAKTQELMDIDFDISRGTSWLCNVDKFKDSNCFIEGNLPPTIVIMGDSHATAIYWGLSKLYKQRGESMALFGGGGGCLPYIDLIVEDAPNENSRHCLEKTQAAIQEVITNKSIKVVIIASRGPLYITEKGFGKIDVKRIMLRLKGEPYGKRTSKEALRIAMTNTISTMQNAGKQIVYLHDVPELGFDIKNCLSSRPLRFRKDFQCAIKKSLFDERYKDFKVFIEDVLVKFPGVKIINLSDALCSDANCIAKRGNRLLYRDDDHLSKFGSEYVVEKLKNEFPQ
ncbi:MAG: acyltransferase [Betaproteobacteria bacterium]|nr:acyltransferase [Betaproteobacteria bacterium]